MHTGVFASTWIVCQNTFEIDCFCGICITGKDQKQRKSGKHFSGKEKNLWSVVESKMVLKLWFLIQKTVELESLLGPQTSISDFLTVLEITIAWSLSFIFPAIFWTTPLPKPVLGHCCPSNWENRIVPTELSCLKNRGKIFRLLIKNVFFHVTWCWPVLSQCCPQTACSILRSPGSICYLIRQLHIGMTTGT